MPSHITKRELVDSLLEEIKKSIDIKNVDVAINILKWTKEKIRLDYLEKRRQYFHLKDKSKSNPRVVIRGQVYGCALGNNIGSEQNGKSRPVLILQGNANSSPTIIIAPMTDAHNKDGSYKHKLDSHVLVKDEKLTKESLIKLEHIRCISKNRLTEPMTNLNKQPEVMNEINEKLIKLFSIKYPIDTHTNM